MPIKIVKDSISKKELQNIAKEQFGDLVKAVVDVEKELVAIGGELHADEEVLLMEKYGSKRESLWGVNIYPDKPQKDMIEFDSMINLKPAFGNRSREVENPRIRKNIKEIFKKMVL